MTTLICRFDIIKQPATLQLKDSRQRSKVTQMGIHLVHKVLQKLLGIPLLLVLESFSEMAKHISEQLNFFFDFVSELAVLEPGCVHVPIVHRHELLVNLSLGVGVGHQFFLIKVVQNIGESRDAH